MLQVELNTNKFSKSLLTSQKNGPSLLQKQIATILQQVSNPEQTIAQNTDNFYIFKIKKAIHFATIP